MYFNGKELKPFAEPVKADFLELQGVYYAVSFADERMAIPVMHTVVFIGENLNEDDADVLYFQDIDSFNAGATFASLDGDSHAMVITVKRHELNGIYDYNEALEILMRCQLRRQNN